MEKFYPAGFSAARTSRRVSVSPEILVQKDKHGIYQAACWVQANTITAGGNERLRRVVGDRATCSKTKKTHTSLSAVQKKPTEVDAGPPWSQKTFKM